MNWHVVSLNSKMELETAQRISDAGFIASCPVWIKKCGHHRNGKHIFQTRVEVLFPRYFFVAQDDAFRKEKFETSKVRLTVFRKRLLNDEAISMINSTALELTMAQSKVPHGIAIKRGDVMQILHGALQGEPVEILHVRKERVLIRLKRAGFESASSVEIGAESLGRAN